MTVLLVGLVGFVAGVVVGFGYVSANLDELVRRTPTFRAYEAHLAAWDVDTLRDVRAVLAATDQTEEE